MKILNTTWINNTTLVIEGKVDIKPLLLRIVSAKGAGIPYAMILVEGPTFIYEHTYTNDSGYVWIDLLLGKDIVIHVYWPPPTIGRENLRLEIPTSSLAKYTNYTAVLKYNLSVVNPIRIVTNEGKPASWIWVEICKKRYLPRTQ